MSGHPGAPSFTGAVATFSDADPSSRRDYTATITWGDGGTTRRGDQRPRRATGATGVFTVSGMHTYAEEGKLRGVGVDRREPTAMPRRSAGPRW